ncbi:MAG: hypothetical protein WC373_14840 [Smithella sp.]|jgi:ABC-type multidrug transport system permease subunit
MIPIGAIIIGVLTSIAGYPIYNFSTGVFSFLNLLIVAGSVSLWYIFIMAVRG